MKIKAVVGEKPLWAQLYDTLKERIQDETYKVGSLFPSETSIISEFDVSRMTVRQAMNKLTEDGYIDRQRGKGTFVCSRKHTIGTVYNSSLNNTKEINYNSDRRVIKVELAECNEEITSFFGIKPNDKVLVLNRRTYIDGIPINNEFSYINPIAELSETDDFSGSLYALLSKKKHEIVKIHESITAKITDEKEKEIFRLNENQALIVRIRKAYDDKGNPIEYSYSKYMADGYELEVLFS